MIKGVATFFIQNDKEEQFLELAKEMIKATVKESGCKEYVLYRDNGEPNVFSMIEDWESQADLDSHGESEHIKRIIPQMMPLFEKEPEIRFYTKIQ